MRRILLLTALAATSVVFICVEACTGDDPETSNAGQYHQPCLSDGTCLGALVCSENVCKNPGEVSSDGGASSSSGGSSSGGASSSGGSSSGGSSSGSSGNDSAFDSGCNSPIHVDAGTYCSGTNCAGDGGWSCCQVSSGGTCNAESSSTKCEGMNGLFMNCDGPRACADRGAGYAYCCLFKNGGVAPARDAGSVCATRFVDGVAVACEGSCASSIQVCDKTAPAFQACLDGGVCTTVEVSVPNADPIKLDVCL